MDSAMQPIDEPSAGFTLADMLRRLAAADPDAPAVTMADTTLSFGELHRRSSQVARALQRQGVRRGDRVALLDKNAPVFYEVLFGVAKLGAVTIGLNYRLAPAELAAIIADAEPAAVLVAPELRHVLPGELSLLELGADFEQWRDAEDGDDVAIDVQPDDVALQLYSSGTTGRPKGAMLTHANLAWTPKMGREYYAMGPGSVNLVPSPLFHIGGVGYALTTMGQGGHTILMRDVDPGLMLRLIEQHAVTHSFMVPAIIQMLVEHPEIARTELGSLQRIAYGGAPIGSALLLKAIGVLGCEFMAVYGMTETAGTVISLPPNDHEPVGPRAGLLRSIGHPLPWLGIRIVDPTELRDSPVGAVGEIWVRSPQNMLGYWKQPEQTAATLVEDGWLRTGDAAFLDEGGYVYMHDRIKDMILSGGENIYPAEVEKVMSGHPAVSDLAVIGVPSDRWGETVKAIVVLRDDFEIDGGELIAWTRERLAHYKCPTSVDFVDALPRNASGKVLKHHLRAHYWTDQGSPA